MREYFSTFAQKTSMAVGSVWAFMLASASVLAWLATGPIFAYSNTWQLVINTGTTIVTFLIVFLIQYTQNRDAQVLHLKLDELIRSLRTARNAFIDLEDFTDQQLAQFQEEFRYLHEKYGDSTSTLQHVLRHQALEELQRRGAGQKKSKESR